MGVNQSIETFWDYIPTLSSERKISESYEELNLPAYLLQIMDNPKIWFYMSDFKVENYSMDKIFLTDLLVFSRDKKTVNAILDKIENLEMKIPEETLLYILENIPIWCSSTQIKVVASTEDLEDSKDFKEIIQFDYDILKRIVGMIDPLSDYCILKSSEILKLHDASNNYIFAEFCSLDKMFFYIIRECTK